MTKLFTNQEILVSAQREASASNTTNIRNYSSLEYVWLLVYITAKSGAPTLALTLQCSPVDPNVDSSKWRTVSSLNLTNAEIGTSFPKILSTTRTADWSGWLRVIYTIAGSSTPKLTFSLSLEAK